MESIFLQWSEKKESNTNVLIEILYYPIREKRVCSQILLDTWPSRMTDPLSTFNMSQLIQSWSRSILRESRKLIRIEKIQLITSHQKKIVIDFKRFSWRSSKKIERTNQTLKFWLILATFEPKKLRSSNDTEYQRLTQHLTLILRNQH